MTDLKPPADMTDQELVREWECVKECDYGAERTNALAAEMERRQVDF